MGSPFIPAPRRRRRHRHSTSLPGIDPDSGSDGGLSINSGSSQGINPFGPQGRQGGFRGRNIFGRQNPTPFPGGGAGRGRFHSRIPVPIGRGSGNGFGAPRRHRSNTPSPPPFTPWYEGSRGPRPGGPVSAFENLQRLLQEQGPAGDPMGYGNPGRSLPFGSGGPRPYSQFDSGPFSGQEASPFYEGGDDDLAFGGGPGFSRPFRQGEMGQRQRRNGGFSDPPWGACSSNGGSIGESDGGFQGDYRRSRFGFGLLNRFGGSDSPPPPPPRRRRRRRQAEPFDLGAAICDWHGV